MSAVRVASACEVPDEQANGVGHTHGDQAASDIAQDCRAAWSLA